MEWNDSAIVLQTGQFREADMWLRIFSQKHGLMTVFAFGGSRSRRRFCGCLDVLNTITCKVKSSRNGQYLALEEGSLQYGPQKLRRDFSRLGMVMNCIRFLEAFGITQEGAPAAYALLQELFLLFEEDAAPHALYPVLFRLRMASEQGFAPAWRHCSVCGAELGREECIFHMNEGMAHCVHCEPERKSLAYTVRLDVETLALLHKVEQAPASEWDIFTLSAKGRQVCFRAIDGFVQFHLGIAWEEGRFRRV